MAKIQSTIVCVLALATLAAAQNSVFNEQPYQSLVQGDGGWFTDKDLRYYLTCYRGLLDGYFKGFYNNNTEGLDKKCMDQTLINQVLAIEDTVATLDTILILKSFGVLYQINRNFDKKCKTNEMMFEMTTWCIRSNQCSWDKLMASIKKNIFVMTGSINDVMQLFFGENSEMDINDLDNAFYTW